MKDIIDDTDNVGQDTVTADTDTTSETPQETGQAELPEPEPQPESEPVSEPETDPDPEPVTTSATEPQTDDIVALISQAEQRGYDRARMELANERMNMPVVGEDSPADYHSVQPLGFLSNLRPSIWD